MKLRGHHFLAMATCLVFGVPVIGVELEPALDELRLVFDGMIEEMNSIKKVIHDLSRQVMLQQLFVEERIRTDGDSGIKVTRGLNKGLRNYDARTNIGGSVNAIHDHSNLDRTVGMGEVNVVLNGVDFRTRHNDYKLVMPSMTSSEYHSVDPIPFPDVPPEVLAFESVDDQIDEMRAWFKAFKDQNSTDRDYTKYFKPVLCYMEGAWTLDKELEEPFQSDRHHLDASSWFDLQEKVRFTSYSGLKSRLENYAYLPTTIMSVNKTTGIPNYAQWNYRIVCYPLDRDIPFTLLQQVDDLSHRVSKGRTLQEVKETRAARFKLYEGSANQKYQVLDEIFYKIPGKDNQPDNLTQATFGEGIMYDMAYSDENVKLDTGFYHRYYKYGDKDAMGITTVARGFNDENLWVAQTTQKRVAPMAIEECTTQRINGKNQEVCETVYNSFSYALPLEIIYLTPLLSWNPYNLTIHEDKYTANMDGRNGGNSLEDAFNGVDWTRYYLTPVEFFKGRTDNPDDPADTVRNGVHVLDPDGVQRRMAASGTRIILPTIEGVGNVRLRYPIAPVHGEGSSVWKELNALKDKTLGGEDGPPSQVSFEMTATVQDPPGEHTHEFDISLEEFQELVKGTPIEVATSQAQGHTHSLTVEYQKNSKSFKYTNCGTSTLCKDGHPTEVLLMTNNIYTELP